MAELNDPLHKPIDEKVKQKIDNAVEKHVRNMSLDENVETDDTKIQGQNYALISIVSPETNQKYDHVCLKIKGVFKTLEDANKHAAMLQKIDSVFDIYVVEMYSWLLVPPDPELLEQKHVDNKLNEIIGCHRESQLKAKAYFDERKRDLTENIQIENVEEESNVEEITNDSSVSAEGPSGVPTESSSLGHCPNSGPDTEEGVSPSELMDEMVKDTLNENLKEID
jgi:uncharacterized protein YutD